MSINIKGALKFMSEGFSEHKEKLLELANEQNPHTLYIGCCDSRVVPNLITQAKIGELFVVRNIANIIPPYRIKDEYLASTAAIEYALEYLDIKEIIICGHSNCGGCKDIDCAQAQKMPNVAKWLSLLRPLKSQIDRQLELSHLEGDAALRAWMIERANVVASYENLLSFPQVMQRIKTNELKIRAWYFVVASAKILEYDPQTGHFVELKGEE